MAELNEVLTRDKFRPYVTDNEARQFLAVLAGASQWVEIDVQISDCRDPSDNKFLGRARADDVAQTAAFAVCGSSLDSRSRTQGQTPVFEICGFSYGRTAVPEDGGPRYAGYVFWRVNISTSTVATTAAVLGEILPNLRTSPCRSMARSWSSATCPRLPWKVSATRVG